MIGNPLTICHNKEESSIDLKRLPVCCSHCLPRENLDELLSFKLYEELNSISCHKPLLCLHLHTCHPWQHMVLFSCRHDEKNICTAHKTTVDICVSHLCHLLKQAVSIMVVSNGSFCCPGLDDYYHANVSLFAEVHQSHTKIGKLQSLVIIQDTV